MADRGDHHDLVRRVADLETIVGRLNSEVQTQRLVLVNAYGIERIVGEVVEVVDGVAEINVDLPGSPSGRQCGVVVFANPGPGDGSLPSGLGVQLWVDGDCVHEVGTWMDRR